MNIFEKMRNAYLRFEDLLFEYSGLEMQIAENALYITNKFSTIRKIPRKNFFDTGLREISELSDYVTTAYHNLKRKAKSIFEKKYANYQTNTDSSLEYEFIKENIHSQTEKYSKNYKKNMEFLYNSNNKLNVQIADILSGKKSWKWDERYVQFKNYLSNKNPCEIDKNAIINSLNSNSYLKKNHSKIYHSLIELLK